MGRVNFADVNNYSNNSGGGGFFSLKNDKDVARVRFMLEDENDLNNIAYAVHRVKIGDSERNVSCLRAYNEPVSKCPFCQDLGPSTLKFYIPLYNEDDEEVQMWERGKTFASKLSGIMSRYGSKTPLVNHIFEIERNGEKGDMKTTYEAYEVDKDETVLADLPEIPEVIGRYVLDKSEDDMNYYLDEGEFPPEEDDAPVRRRNSKSDDGYVKLAEDEDDEDMPFEEAPVEERTTRRRGSERSSNSNSSRRTPSSSNKGGNASRRRSF